MSATHFEVRDETAWIHIDDGKANAISSPLLSEIHAALDRAEKEAGSVVLVGRPGRFSGGFDLSELAQGGDAVRNLVLGGARLALRLYGFPVPVVVAATGHAIAMGSILLMAADRRIGSQGDFKIGLNEVAIGMTLPPFGIEFARERLSKRHFQRAVIQAEMYGPEGAVDAGFLDETAPADGLLERAAEIARQLEALDARALQGTKLRARGPALARIEASLEGPL